MNLAIEFGTIVVEVFLAFYFYNGMLGPEQQTKGKTALYYLLYGVVLAIGTLWVSSAILRALPLFAISLFGNRTIYRRGWIKVAYVTAIHFILIILADVLCGGILLLAGLPSEELLGAGVGRLVYNCFAKIVHLFFLQIVLTIARKSQDNSEALIHAIPLILCQIASGFICYQSFFVLTDHGQPIVITLETVCLLLINIVICVYVELIKKYYTQREQFEMQREYYAGLLERQEETRALWHDIKKYMAVMEDLVSESNQEEAQSCFAQVQASFSQVNDTVDVGNPMIDHILSRCLKKCRECGIKLHLNIWVSEQIDLLASDLYVIIGNTVDNAITACQRLPAEKRAIDLTLKQKNHILCYEISNEYVDAPTRKEGLHGYGLRNVRNCVNRNNGYMTVEKENGKFVVTIRLEA
jgi:hypothetical protein